MNWRFSSTFKASWPLLGLGFVVIGACFAYETRRFIRASVRAQGTVFHSSENESNTMLVEIRTQDGRLERLIPVQVSWWTPPWRYLRGDPVRILYNPRGDYNSPFFGDQGRVDSWAQLWGGTVFSFALGLVAGVGWFWARWVGARTRFKAGLTVESFERD